MDKVEKAFIERVEKAFIERFGKSKDRHEKKLKKYDYWDMIDFAEQYAQQVSRGVAIKFAKNLLQYLPGDIAPFEEGNCEWFFDKWKSNQEDK